MLKYAKIENEETKECSIGIGTNAEFYQSIGMIEQDVEQGYNGSWYISGYAPDKPIELQTAEKRAERDVILQSTDIYMLPDYPITEEERESYKQYRQYLRDLPSDEAFPNVAIQTFDEWDNINHDVNKSEEKNV